MVTIRITSKAQATAMATKISSSSSSSSSSRTCMCSPTSHPGSFRCGQHRRSPSKSQSHYHANSQKTMPVVLTNNYNSNCSSTASKTSLLKDFHKQIIKPSGHDVQRRRNFHPKPTRFSPMNSANADGFAVS